MKILFILTLLTMLSACGAGDRLGAHLTGYTKICVDGVTYLQFTSGASVQIDKNGKVITCN